MSKFLNFKKLITRVWIILWAILLILLVLKFGFHMWYPVVIENKIIVNICNWIDNHTILLYFIQANFACLNCVIIYLIATVTKKPKLFEILIVCVIAVVGSVIKHYSQGLGYICDFIVSILLPIIINLERKTFKKIIWNILFPIIVNVILFIWQLSIFLIRDINALLTQMPSLISLAMQADYYIFLIISYIGVCHMGAWGLWLWGKSTTELEEIKAKELAKKEPDQELIKKIDEIIAENEER